MRDNDDSNTVEDNTPCTLSSRVLGISKHSNGIHSKLEIVKNELHNGLCFTEQYNTKSVTFFGSSRFGEDNKYYQLARELAKKIVQELNYSIVSGGGGGIMEAANRGATEAGGKSVGYTIQLPNEQKTNKYVNDEIKFKYFFTRKVSLVYSAEAFVYFPGGYGTLDEFFEVITLVQTSKIDKVPIIAFGSDFWNNLDRFIEEVLAQKFETISKKDRNLYTITDSIDEVVDIIRNSKVYKSSQHPQII